jgi:hypothetical protein
MSGGFGFLEGQLENMKQPAPQYPVIPVLLQYTIMALEEVN